MHAQLARLGTSASQVGTNSKTKGKYQANNDAGNQQKNNDNEHNKTKGKYQANNVDNKIKPTITI